MYEFKETINYFKNATISFSNPESGAMAMKVRDLAIEALEKQIPKKPVGWSDDKKDYYFCPICNYEDGIEKLQRFCDTCGQAIDWSEEDSK